MVVRDVIKARVLDWDVLKKEHGGRKVVEGEEAIEVMEVKDGVVRGEDSGAPDNDETEMEEMEVDEEESDADLIPPGGDHNLEGWMATRLTGTLYVQRNRAYTPQHPAIFLCHGTEDVFHLFYSIFVY